MPIILLIRHGENNYVKEQRHPGRKPGIHLNKKGRAQAKAIAEKLKSAPIKAVYSSPLERTMETAKPIAKALDLNVIPRLGLIEADIGDWQGKKMEKIRKSKQWPQVQLNPSRFRFPGGERIADAQHRLIEEVEFLAGKHDRGDMLVCVSHADPIKIIVAYYIGLPLDMFQRLQVSPGSITGLNIAEIGSHLLFMNYDPSLNFAKR